VHNGVLRSGSAGADTRSADSPLGLAKDVLRLAHHALDDFPGAVTSVVRLMDWPTARGARCRPLLCPEVIDYGKAPQTQVIERVTGIATDTRILKNI